MFPDIGSIIAGTPNEPVQGSGVVGKVIRKRKRRPSLTRPRSMMRDSSDIHVAATDQHGDIFFPDISILRLIVVQRSPLAPAPSA